MIKHFLKIFIVSFTLITAILSVTSLGYILIEKDVKIGMMKQAASNMISENQLNKSSTYNYTTVFGKTVKQSKRLNILLVGLENIRTDTIMAVSYDTEKKKADIISIPRDTYYPRNANDRADAKKINAVYGSEGIEGLTKAVQKLLGIPIEKYIVVDYDCVVTCVDMLGGIEVDVPFHMVYDDPYDDPPLHIDIPKGLQVLNGEESLKFLRYRKGYDNQDLGRINAQQQFIKKCLTKSMGLQLPGLINKAYTYIDTNLNVGDILNLAKDAIGFDPNNINMQIMPGVESPLEGLSFYIPDNDEIAKQMHILYNVPQN